MGSHSNNDILKDECSSWTKTQSWAVFWFVAVIVLGPLFAMNLARIDDWMYKSNGEVNIAGVKLFDNEKYVDNRHAGFSIKSERVDLRAKNDLSLVYKKLVDPEYSTK